ncbi:MAG: SsrA-binding protein SmpB [bacterium]
MKVVAINRKARHDYNVLDTYEAGVVLFGGEVKSLRQGNVSMSDAYGGVISGEVFLFNLHISIYKHSTVGKSDPKRKRKLLLNQREIKKIYGLVQQRGNTLIPLKVYFNDRGYAKVTIGACQRKRMYDKKEKILKREIERKVGRIKRSAR